MTDYLTISPERLVHFQCPRCRGWWSIGDAPQRDFWFCPWCGEKSQVSEDDREYTYSEIMKKYFPEAEAEKEEWYTEDTVKTRQVKARIGTTTTRPDFPVVYDEE